MPQEFFWKIVDGLDSLARSEMLTSKSHAWDIANKVKNQTSDYAFDSFQGVDGRWRWRVTGMNGLKVVSSTGSFTYAWEADGQRDQVKKAAPYAIVRDMT